MTPYQFFKKHAGYSYDPKTETREQGRKRCARELAKAESLFLSAEDENLFYEQREDFDDCCLGDFESVEDYRSGKYIMYTCVIMLRGHCIASLGGVGVASSNDPYLRVVRAELALEATDEINDYLAEQIEEQVTE